MADTKPSAMTPIVSPTTDILWACTDSGGAQKSMDTSTLLGGHSGGLTIKGGTAAGEDLTLQSTNHATKGSIIVGTALELDQANGRIGVGRTSPVVAVDIEAASAAAVRIKNTSAAADEGIYRMTVDSAGSYSIRPFTDASVSGTTQLQLTRVTAAGEIDRVRIGDSASAPWTLEVDITNGHCNIEIPTSAPDDSLLSNEQCAFYRVGTDFRVKHKTGGVTKTASLGTLA